MNGGVITNLGLLYIGTDMPKTMQTPLMSIFWAFFGEGILFFWGILSFGGILSFWGILFFGGILSFGGILFLGYCLLSGLASSRCLANVKSSIDEVVLDNRKLKVAN